MLLGRWVLHHLLWALFLSKKPQLDVMPPLNLKLVLTPPVTSDLDQESKPRTPEIGLPDPDEQLASHLFGAGEGSPSTADRGPPGSQAASKTSAAEEVTAESSAWLLCAGSENDGRDSLGDFVDTQGELDLVAQPLFTGEPSLLDGDVLQQAESASPSSPAKRGELVLAYFPPSPSSDSTTLLKDKEVANRDLARAQSLEGSQEELADIRVQEAEGEQNSREEEFTFLGSQSVATATTNESSSGSAAAIGLGSGTSSAQKLTSGTTTVTKGSSLASCPTTPRSLGLTTPRSLVVTPRSMASAGQQHSSSRTSVLNSEFGLDRRRGAPFTCTASRIPKAKVSMVPGPGSYEPPMSSFQQKGCSRFSSTERKTMVYSANSVPESDTFGKYNPPLRSASPKTFTFRTASRWLEDDMEAKIKGPVPGPMTYVPRRHYCSNFV